MNVLYFGSENELNAKSIFQSFCSEIALEGKYPLDCEERSGEYTRKVKDVIEKISGVTSLTYWPEYYKIDHVIGTDTKASEAEKAKQVGFKAHGWSIRAVIEHENKHDDWNEEVIKLAPFHCPLRVVIGYNKAESRDCGNESDENRLRYLADILGRMEDCGCLAKCGEFMIILGNSGWDKADFRAYLYDFDNHRFERHFMN